MCLFWVHQLSFFHFTLFESTWHFHVRLEVTVSQFRNLFIVSYSPRHLFEQISRTTYRSGGSWLRPLLLQGQQTPVNLFSLSGIINPRKWSWTHTSHSEHSKALSSTFGAKIQFHAVCQLLSQLAKEKHLTVFHYLVVQGNVCICVESVWCLCTNHMPSCLWSVCTLILSCGKLPRINMLYNWSPWFNWFSQSFVNPKALFWAVQLVWPTGFMEEKQSLGLSGSWSLNCYF